jgi:hypothetical protein
MTRTILWKPDRWYWQDKLRVVWVDVPKLDASWREDAPMWLPPGSGARIGRWLAKQTSPRVRVMMPVVGWLPHAIRDERGRWLADSDRHHIVFENGRHRTAYMRDHGATAMPVLAYYAVADIIAAELGTSERRTVVECWGPRERRPPYRYTALASRRPTDTPRNR